MELGRRLTTSYLGRGYDLTYKTPKDTSLSLFLHGEPAYSHLLLLPPKSKGLGPALSPNLIVDFVNAGSNVLLALSGGDNTVPAAIASLLLELDIQLPPERNSVVVDHFNYDIKSAVDTHDVVLASVKSPKVHNFFSLEGLIAFPRAVGQVLGNASPLLSPVVRAASTAYTYNPKDSDSDDEAFATGSQISLVTAFQGRNSARFAILGSAEALEDKWFGATVQLPAQKAVKTVNEVFATALSAWTFKELGVLKVNTINHFLNEGTQRGIRAEDTASSLDLNPGIYRVKNDVSYSVSISSWTLDHWEPFALPAGDELQLEVSMLSPFHRLNLKPIKSTANETTYNREFKLPDQHGIFNLFLEYRRPFFTNLEEKRTVTVRHFAHDEWPRSFVISGAYPWIGGIWVTIAGFIGFVAIWLYSAPAQPKQDLKKR